MLARRRAPFFTFAPHPDSKPLPDPIFDYNKLRK
jgi:hypothetical protein